MTEKIIKADIRAIRRWLVSIMNDSDMPERDRWMARQTLDKINRAGHEL